MRNHGKNHGLLLIPLVLIVVHGIDDISSAQDAVTRHPKYTEWLKHSKSVRQSANTVLHYDFEDRGGRALRNNASGSNIEGYRADELNGTIDQGTWTEGRWPGKGAARPPICRSQPGCASI